MKILFVCSGNANYIAPFILDLKKDLESKNIMVDIFKIKGTGVLGYLKNLIPLNKKIANEYYDLIHAHYGLSSLLACLQIKIPVIITLHGSDVYNKNHRYFTKIAVRLANKVIIVSEKMSVLLKVRHLTILPCGVDLIIFKPMDKTIARETLDKNDIYKFDHDRKYVLFSSSFTRSVKNPQLAKDAIELLGKTYELIELKKFSRNEVALLMNSVDAALLTSKSEGSPQFIKEAMACSCPIVSTNVGDVEEIIDNTNGCYISPPNIHEISKYIKKACTDIRTNGRDKIVNNYDSNAIANKTIDMYNSIIGKGRINLFFRKFK